MTAIGPGTRLRAVDDGHDHTWIKELALPRLTVGRVYTCDVAQEMDYVTPCAIHTGNCTALVTVREMPRLTRQVLGIHMQLAYCLRSFRPADEDPGWFVELSEIARNPGLLEENPPITETELNPV